MSKSVKSTAIVFTLILLMYQSIHVMGVRALAIDYTNGSQVEDQTSEFRFTDDTLPKADPAEETQQTEGDVTGDKIETEKKFLVDIDKLPSNMKSIAYNFDFVQTYISYLPEMRVRAFDSRYFFTMKRPADEIGLSREEMQVQITKAEYESLLTKKVGQTIYKTRYQFYSGDTFVYVDIYTGSLAGLIVAEVEFANVAVAEKFTPPSWFGKDVTSDKRYKNANLSKDGMPNPL